METPLATDQAAPVGHPLWKEPVAEGGGAVAKRTSQGKGDKQGGARSATGSGRRGHDWTIDGFAAARGPLAPRHVAHAIGGSRERRRHYRVSRRTSRQMGGGRPATGRTVQANRGRRQESRRYSPPICCNRRWHHRGCGRVG